MLEELQKQKDEQLQ